MVWNEITVWNAVVVSFALTAAVGDVRWRKIPKGFTTAGIALGLGFHAIHGNLGDLGWSLAACLIGFAIGLTFFQLGAIGGGDVKLIMALGAMLGFQRWFRAMEVAIFTSAAIALVQAVRRGLLRQTLANVVDTFRWVVVSGGKPHPVVNVSNPAMLRAPFGIAAALGTLFAVLRP